MKNKWQCQKIGDVCVVERGSSPRPIDQFITEDGGGINWIKIGDTTESMYITETAQKIKPEGMKKSRYVEPGDFLLSNSMSFGRPYILKIDGCIHDGWLVLKDKDEIFDKRFLYYYLSAKATYQKFKHMAVGGVVNNLNSEMVRKIDVPVPSKDEQMDTADLLDKICNIISLRKRELDCLDDLIRARFVEMFGDRNYPSEPLDNNVVEMFIGPFGSSLKNEVFVDEENGFCMVYEQKHAIQKTMNVPTRYVSKSKYEELKRFTILGGDIIVSCRGTIGEIFIVPDNAPMGIMHPSIMKIRLNTEKYNQKFFVFALQQYMDEHNAEAKGSGVKMAVSATVLGQSDFVIPPMEMQNQFADFVKVVDKSKAAVQKALDQAQLLFDSLMQEYFG